MSVDPGSTYTENKPSSPHSVIVRLGGTLRHGQCNLVGDIDVLAVAIKGHVEPTGALKAEAEIVLAKSGDASQFLRRSTFMGDVQKTREELQHFKSQAP